MKCVTLSTLRRGPRRNAQSISRRCFKMILRCLEGIDHDDVVAACEFNRDRGHWLNEGRRTQIRTFTISPRSIQLSSGGISSRNNAKVLGVTPVARTVATRRRFVVDDCCDLRGSTALRLLRVGSPRTTMVTNVLMRCFQRAEWRHL